MKAFTDIQQSKKLAEFLPFESADLWYAEIYEGKIEGYNYIVSDTPYYCISFTKPSENNYSQNIVKDIPCWNLAALFDAMPSEVVDNHFLTLHKEGGEYCCCYENYNGHSIKGCFSDNPIDACVEMINKLKEKI